jgi:GT2 family glycosyltransferase
MENRTKVSVVIPTWNGRDLLKACLQALTTQTLEPAEIIVVDNGSHDGTADWLRATQSHVTLVTLSKNRGVATAFNTGIAKASTPLVALLNNDVIAEPAWLAELVTGMGSDVSIGSCASKMLFAHDRVTINAVGDVYHVNGIPGNRGVWEHDNGQYDTPDYVFGASGGAALYRATVLADVGPFDENFVSYCEDVDWSFRAQLAGYRCRYVPSARVYHMGSATGGGTYASFHCGRNFIATAVKNIPGPIWRRNWSHIVRAQLGLAIESLRHGREPAARARLQGQTAAVCALPRLLRERRSIKNNVRVSARYIEQLLAA